MTLLLVGATGCSSTPKVVGYSEGPYDMTLVLPGDLISISFPGATNLNTTLKVPVDGEIRLPAAFGKPVNATGKTRAELEKALLDEFGSQLRSPEVNVSLITSAAVVYISGAVLAPNKVAMDRPLTLMDAIMEAGGPDSRRANLGSVAVVRNFEGTQQTYVIDMRKAFTGGEVMPFYLRPFDSIVVPARKFNF
jgi:polysaccharide export outer membrane protein